MPTGADELAVLGLDPDLAIEAMFERCVLERGPAAPASDLVAEFATRLAEEAPVLDLPLAAVCPECGHDGAVEFRVQTWLLRALMSERAALPAQLHALARAYGWGAAEILGLPRALRLDLVRMAEPSRASRRAA